MQTSNPPKQDLTKFSSILLKLSSGFNIKKPVTEIDAMADIGFLNKNDFDHIYIQTPAGPRTFNSEYGIGACREFLQRLQEAKFMEQHNVATLENVCEKITEFGIFVDDEFIGDFFGNTEELKISTREAALNSEVGKVKKYFVATGGLLSEIDRSENATRRQMMNAQPELTEAQKRQKRNEQKAHDNYLKDQAEERRIRQQSTSNSPTSPGYYDEKHQEYQDGVYQEGSYQEQSSSETFSTEGLTGKSWDDNSSAAKKNDEQIYAQKLYEEKFKNLEKSYTENEAAATEKYKATTESYEAEKEQLYNDKSYQEKRIEELNAAYGVQTQPSSEVHGFSEQIVSEVPVDKYAYLESVYESTTIPDPVKDEYRQAMESISSIDKQIQETDTEISKAKTSYEAEIELLKASRDHQEQVLNLNYRHDEIAAKLNEEFSTIQTSYISEQAQLESERKICEDKISELNSTYGISKEQFQAYISSEFKETISSSYKPEKVHSDTESYKPNSVHSDTESYKPEKIYSETHTSAVQHIQHVLPPEVVTEYKKAAEQYVTTTSAITKSKEFFEEKKAEYNENYKNNDSAQIQKLDTLRKNHETRVDKIETLHQMKENNPEYILLQEKKAQSEHAKHIAIAHEVVTNTGHNVPDINKKPDLVKTYVTKAISEESRNASFGKSLSPDNSPKAPESNNKTNQERFNSDAQAVTIKTAVFEEHSSETKGGQTTSAHAQLGDKSIKDQAVNVNKQAAEIKTNTNINVGQENKKAITPQEQQKQIKQDEQAQKISKDTAHVRLGGEKFGETSTDVNATRKLTLGVAIDTVAKNTIIQSQSTIDSTNVSSVNGMMQKVTLSTAITDFGQKNVKEFKDINSYEDSMQYSQMKKTNKATSNSSSDNANFTPEKAKELSRKNAQQNGTSASTTLNNEKKGKASEPLSVGNTHHAVVNADNSMRKNVSNTKVQAFKDLASEIVKNKLNATTFNNLTQKLPTKEDIKRDLLSSAKSIDRATVATLDFAARNAQRFGSVVGLQRDETFAVMSGALRYAQPMAKLAADAAIAVAVLHRADKIRASIDFNVLEKAYATRLTDTGRTTVATKKQIEVLKNSYHVDTNAFTKIDAKLTNFKNMYGVGNISNKNLKEIFNFSAADLKKMSSMSFADIQKTFGIKMSEAEFTKILNSGLLDRSAKDLKGISNQLTTAIDAHSAAYKKMNAFNMKKTMSAGLSDITQQYALKYGLDAKALTRKNVNSMYKKLKAEIDAKKFTGTELENKKKQLEEMKNILSMTDKVNGTAMMTKFKETFKKSKGMIFGAVVAAVSSKDGIERDIADFARTVGRFNVVSRYNSFRNALRWRQNLRLKRMDRLKNLSNRLNTPGQYSKRQLKRATKASNKLTKLSKKKLTKRARLGVLRRQRTTNRAVRRIRKLTNKFTGKFTGKLTGKLAEKVGAKVVSVASEKLAGNALMSTIIASGPWGWLIALLIAIAICCCLCVCTSGASYSTYTTVDAFQLTALHKATDSPQNSLAARTMAFLDSVYEENYETFIWNGVNEFMGEGSDIATNGIEEDFVFEKITYDKGKITVVKGTMVDGVLQLELPSIIHKYVFVQDATSIYYNDANNTMTQLFAGKSLSLTNENHKYAIEQENTNPIEVNKMHNRIYNEKEIIAMTSISFANDLVVDTTGNYTSVYENTIGDNYEKYAFTLWLTSHYCILDDDTINQDEGKKNSKNWWQRFWSSLFGSDESTSETSATEGMKAVEKKFGDTDKIKLADLTGAWELDENGQIPVEGGEPIDPINKIVPLNENAFFPSKGHGIGTEISHKDSSVATQLKTDVAGLSTTDKYTITGDWSDKNVYEKIDYDIPGYKAYAMGNMLNSVDSIFTVDIKTNYQYTHYSYSYLNPSINSVSGLDYQYNTNNKFDKLYQAAQVAGQAKQTEYETAWTNYQEALHNYETGASTVAPTPPSITEQDVIDAYNSWVDDIAAIDIGSYIGNSGDYVIRKDVGNGYVFADKESAKNEAIAIINKIYDKVEGSEYFYCKSESKPGSETPGKESGSNLANATACGVASIPMTPDYITRDMAIQYVEDFYSNPDNSSYYTVSIRNDLNIAAHPYKNYLYKQNTSNSQRVDELELDKSEVFNLNINYNQTAKTLKIEDSGTKTLYKFASYASDQTKGTLTNTTPKYTYREYCYPITNKTSPSNYIKSTDITQLLDLTDKSENANKRIYFATKQYREIKNYARNCGQTQHTHKYANGTRSYSATTSSTYGGCFKYTVYKGCYYSTTSTTSSGGSKYCGPCGAYKNCTKLTWTSDCGNTASMYKCPSGHIVSGSNASGDYCCQGEVDYYSRNCGYTSEHTHKYADGTASGSATTSSTKGGCFNETKYEDKSCAALIAIIDGSVYEIQTRSGYLAMDNLKSYVNGKKSSENIYYEISDFYQETTPKEVSLNYTLTDAKESYVMPFFSTMGISNITDPVVSVGSTTPTYITFKDLYSHFFVCGGHTQLVVQPVILNFVGKTTMFDTDEICQQLEVSEQAAEGEETIWEQRFSSSTSIADRYAVILGCTLPNKSYIISNENTNAGIWEITTPVGRENIVNAVNMVGHNWEQQYRFSYDDISFTETEVACAPSYGINSTRKILIDPLSWHLAATDEEYDNDTTFVKATYHNASSTPVGSIEAMMKNVFKTLGASQDGNPTTLDLDGDGKIDNLDYDEAVKQGAASSTLTDILSAIDRADRCMVALGLVGKVGYTQAAHDYTSQGPLKEYWSFNSTVQSTVTYEDDKGVTHTMKLSELLGMGDSYDYGLLYACDCSGFASYMLGVDNNIFSTGIDSFEVVLPSKEEVLKSMDFDPTQADAWSKFNPTIQALYNKATAIGSTYKLFFNSKSISNYSDLSPGDVLYRSTSGSTSGHAMVFIARTNAGNVFVDCTTSGNNSSKIGPGTIAVEIYTDAQLAEKGYVKYYDVDFDVRKINFKIIY